MGRGRALCLSILARARVELACLFVDRRASEKSEGIALLLTRRPPLLVRRETNKRETLCAGGLVRRRANLSAKQARMGAKLPPHFFVIAPAHW